MSIQHGIRASSSYGSSSRHNILGSDNYASWKDRMAATLCILMRSYTSLLWLSAYSLCKDSSTAMSHLFSTLFLQKLYSHFSQTALCSRSDYLASTKDAWHSTTTWRLNYQQQRRKSSAASSLWTFYINDSATMANQHFSDSSQQTWPLAWSWRRARTCHLVTLVNLGSRQGHHIHRCRSCTIQQSHFNSSSWTWQGQSHHTAWEAHVSS